MQSGWSNGEVKNEEIFSLFVVKSSQSHWHNLKINLTSKPSKFYFWNTASIFQDFGKSCRIAVKIQLYEIVKNMIWTRTPNRHPGFKQCEQELLTVIRLIICVRLPSKHRRHGRFGSTLAWTFGLRDFTVHFSSVSNVDSEVQHRLSWFTFDSKKEDITVLRYKNPYHCPTFAIRYFTLI